MAGFTQIIEQILRLDFSSLYEFSPVAIFFILFFATFITEDATCLAAGALAGQGRISFLLALSACFLGIFISDVWLYWVGRIFGNSISKTRVFKRIVSERRLNQATTWLEKRGPMAIIISRFVSGLRLPTYLAAGFLKANFLKFVFYFLVASAVWTPLLVGSAMFAQKLISPQYILLSIVSLFIVLKTLFNLSTWRKRRLAIGRLKRMRNWEFWPLIVFYLPVVFYIGILAAKFRSLTVFTCVNPAIPASGFIGESKSEIYEGLEGSAGAFGYLLSFLKLAEQFSPEQKHSKTLEFIQCENLVFPVAVKPDVGERGKDTSIAHCDKQLIKILGAIEKDVIVQEFAPGPEVSIFYYRYPSEKKGKIFSITEKSFPTITGDGVSNLETLILLDERAVCLAQKYFDQNEGQLEGIPEKGENVKLIDIGTHSRGAIFKEGDWLKTEKLEQKIDEICQGYKGFYFGRFDIRARSFEDLKQGKNFKIIELNGVTSESTNIYDKRYSLLHAYRILFAQWRIAFEIGAENKALGAKPTSISDLIRLLRGRQIARTKSETREICA